MKKVFKYGTGQPIPEGAIYLSTQVETRTKYRDNEYSNGRPVESITSNEYVWHYFLVDPEVVTDLQDMIDKVKP